MEPVIGSAWISEETFLRLGRFNVRPTPLSVCLFNGAPEMTISPSFTFLPRDRYVKLTFVTLHRSAMAHRGLGAPHQKGLCPRAPMAGEGTYPGQGDNEPHAL